MTDKQQTKEEIILAVKDAIYNNAEIDVECDCVQTDGNGVDHIADEVAEALYKANYRQVSPNAVVLTAEKLAEFETACRKAWCEAWDKSRAKTAREILEEFANLEVGDCLVAWDVIAKVSDKILEIAKQYGVGVDNETK